MTLLSPGQQVTEIAPKVVTIAGTSISTRAVIGVTEKGPVGLGQVTTSWDQWQSIYGGFIAEGWTAYAVYMIYKGNPGARVYTVRVAHYTDITDPVTLTALASSATLMDTATTPVATIKASASSPGTHGDALKVVIAANGTDKFDLTVLETVGGEDVERDKFIGLSMDPADTTNYFETRVNGKQQKLVTLEDQDSATAAPANIPAAGTFSLTGGNNGLTSLADTDFIGDTGSKSGISGLNGISGLLTFAIPGKSSSAVHTAAIAYCTTQKTRYFVGDLAFGVDADAAVEYRSTTLGANTDYAEFNWPHLKIMDPLTSLPLVVPNSGFIMAAMGRTFDDPEKGPWKAAAGVTDGVMLGAIGLENEDVNQVGTRDTLYQAQINPIYFVPAYGICRMGCRTLTADPNKLQNANQRWTFLFCEQSIKDGTVWAMFENIDTALFKKLERTIKSFLLRVWRRDGLKGDAPENAFFVQVDAGNNPESEIQLGNIHHRIGLAVHTPGQFQYFTFERDTRALEAELSSAGL